MGLLSMFGLGAGRLLREGRSVEGTVVSAAECWWLKVNTKPVRWSGTDGAVYPHIITFRYSVDGVEYTGRRWLDHTVNCPVVGKRVFLHYDPEHPKHCAMETAQFGVRI